MEITVFVTRVEGNGYRASSTAPVPVSVEAPTRDEAVRHLREAVGRMLAGGEVLRMEVGSATRPFAEFGGMFKDDPSFDEWRECIEEHRARKDAEEEARLP